MSASLLAKLTPRGISLDGGFGGIPLMTQMDVAASLSACKHESYLALTAKYTDDQKSQKALIGLLSSIAQAKLLRGKDKPPIGYAEFSRKMGELVFLQFMDGYRCNHCGGSGEVANKVCGNCKGHLKGCFSDEFRKEWLEVDSYSPWKLIVEDLEVDVNTWEHDGLRALRRAAG